MYLKIILIISCLLLFVESHPFQTLKWTAQLGEQYPGVTPLFNRLNNGIAIASLLQDNNRQFHWVVQRYSIYGKIEAKCDLIIPNVSKRIWDLKMQQESDSTTLAFSWLYNDGTELGIRVLEVNVATCNLRDSRVPLYGDLDLVLYVPYYLLPRAHSGLFLFVKSPEICEGICRLEIGKGEQIAGNDGTFITAKDDSLVWRILAVNPENLSEGYYYISEEDAATGSIVKIEKLNSVGTVLHTLKTEYHRSDSLAMSNTHARLSVCSSSNCFLLDPNTFQLKLNVSVARNVTTVNNIKDSAILVINDANNATKYQPLEEDTSVRLAVKSESIPLFRGFNKDKKCFDRKIYQGFEVGNSYCTGRACMSKANVSDVFYQVSVAVECFRIL